MPLSPQQIAEHAQRLAQFAELLSLDLGTREVAERMGITPKRAEKYLSRLRKDLGPQAC
jgi:DNA-binding CsgD family transcriptional regulator